MIHLAVSEPAASLPVTLAELKAHLRIGLSVEDGPLTIFLSAACDRLISETGYTPIETTYQLTLDMPTDRVIHLPRWPLESIEVVEVDGYETEDYELAADGRSITLGGTVTGESVVVDFICSDTSTKAAAKVAILMLAAHYYAARESHISSPFEMRTVPMGWDRITRSLRGSYGLREQL